MIPLGLYGAARPVASGGGGLTFRGGRIATANSSTHSFSVPIGWASATRSLVIAVGFFAASDRAIDIDVDGTAITEDFEYGGALSNRHNIAIGHIAWPTGTTAVVGVTLSAAVYDLGCYVWSIDGVLTATETGATYSGGGSPSRVVTVPSGGFAVAVSTVNSQPASYSWSGATGDDSNDGGSYANAAAHLTASATVTAASGIASTTGLATVAYSVA